jgi:pimeloyl-ACP methyl ester carboxylesterase
MENASLRGTARGRAFADAIPRARFEVLSETGHLPQLESPEKLSALLEDFVSPPHVEAQEV